MSDYISKNETIKALRNYAEKKHCGGETVLANGILKAVCFIEKEENIPTLSETEIIRKTAERIINRLEYQEKQYESRAEKFAEALNSWEESRNRGKAYSYGYAIEIVKEECGIDE